VKKFILGMLFFLSTLLTAGDNPRAVIIFDASGSMWGQINGVTKIEIARDALKNVVKEWNPSVELGLTVYGHRKKGDCNDIESVIPVGKIDKNRVIRTVMGIKPKGKTPISRSLRKVAEELKYTEEKATIILISDGKETCDPDPCATAKELKKEGIDFVTHVIGFNVDKKTDKQLECIANATGGEYFSAKNASALNKAIKVIAKKVEVAKPKPKPMVKKLKNNLEISASEKENAKWIKASHVIYKVVDGEKDDSSTTSCSSFKKKACLEQIPVGIYIIHSRYNDFKKDTPFEVKAGEVTKVHVVMGQTGKVEISASEKENGKWIKAYHDIHKVIDGKKEYFSTTSCSSFKKKTCLEQIPIGKYTMHSSYSNIKKDTPFEVKAGEVTKVQVVMGQTGKVEISASEKGGSKWIEAQHSIFVVEDGELGHSVDNCWSYKKKECLKQIPIGKYVLKSKYNEFKKDTAFEVKSGEVTKVQVVFGQTSTVKVSASEKEGGKWIDTSCSIYNEDKSDSWGIYPRKRESSASQKRLPVGKYTLECKYNAFKKKDIPVEIKAGEATKVHVIFNQFFIEAKCLNSGDNIAYEIYASSGQLVYEKKKKCSDTLKVTLDKGDYSVEAKVGNDTKEVKFTVGGNSNKLLIDMTNTQK